MSALATARTKLGPAKSKLAIVAVSVDPRGDTPKAVRQFLAARRLVGRADYLIGTRKELEPVWTAAPPGSRSRSMKKGASALAAAEAIEEVTGVAYDPNATPEDGTWGYTRSQTAESYHGLYQRLLKVVNETFMFSGFCYTQFADTFQEANGLLNADRTPKLPFEVISAATRNVPLQTRDAQEEGEGPGPA